MSAVIERPADGIIMEKVVAGDLSGLTPAQRATHAINVCHSIGLNPETAPFQFVSFQGKVVMYATKSCTEQLRKIHNISLKIVSREIVDDIYIVTAMATMPNGRTDESVGAVNIAGLKGDGKANAIMKTETKAKRRVTLSICGLGFLDESELETIPGAKALPEQSTTPANNSRLTGTATNGDSNKPVPVEAEKQLPAEPPQDNGELASKSRLKLIGQLLKAAHAADGFVYGKEQCKDDFGVESLNDLTAFQAWHLANFLMTRNQTQQEVTA